MNVWVGLTRVLVSVVSQYDVGCIGGVSAMGCYDLGTSRTEKPLVGTLDPYSHVIGQCLSWFRLFSFTSSFARVLLLATV
jgi:hypothetical protein